MTEKRALVLDFGGVISRTLFETHHITEQALGLPPGSLTWRGPFDPASDPLWVDMQENRITERQYWNIRIAEISRLFGEHWEMSDFVRRARGNDPISVMRPEAVRTIEAAASAGKRLAILSNELDLFYGKGFTSRFPLLSGFEVVVDATYTGILKPDPRAYELCLAALKLSADQCVFVDDQQRNIDGAEKIGMSTVHFDVRAPKRSYAQVLTKLGLPAELLDLV
ncbi:HAD-IA family hydrolase [Bradyrhizobium sp. Cp5.3]|uniref:HAD-IA family hydrolase n=1 Tax=Bradyrhizobium sp. Cp5.3 TaxID=443598 RepID=UPI0004848979|nr:HAD-IA family hydrolase [Bradyrhizobium sp. Cp5.3]